MTGCYGECVMVTNGYENICTNCGIVKMIITNCGITEINSNERINPVIEHMVTSLLFEEGMCQLINEYVHDYKQTKKISNMKEFVCAALIFQTKISNMRHYVNHFNLDIKKVSKFYDEFIGMYSLNRCNMIEYYCNELCLEFKLDYDKIKGLNLNEYMNYRASERAIACGIVSFFFNQNVRIFTNHLGISYAPSMKFLNYLKDFKP